jgi:hypothetical protein
MVSVNAHAEDMIQDDFSETIEVFSKKYNIDLKKENQNKIIIEILEKSTISLDHPLFKVRVAKLRDL